MRVSWGWNCAPRLNSFPQREFESFRHFIPPGGPAIRYCLRPREGMRRGRSGAGLKLKSYPPSISGLFFSPYLFSTTWPGLFLALFFPQLRIFNNFSALFFGLFRFVFQGRHFVINNFSALFFKITSFLSHNFNAKTKRSIF